MIDAKNGETDLGPDRPEWGLNTPRDLVSPLDFAGGLQAPALSDDELDELCSIEIAALSQPRTNAAR